MQPPRKRFEGYVHAIAGPTGSSVNHLRLLLMLSGEYGMDYSYIAHKIYPKERNIFNWLQYEWNCRQSLNYLMSLSHYIGDVAESSYPIKAIRLSVDGRSSLHHYLKLNPTLNGYSVTDFLDNVNKLNKTNFAFTFRKEDLVLNLDSHRLHKPILDEQLYSEAVEFLGVQNVYETAAKAHTLWYDLHERGREEVKLAFQNRYIWTEPTVYPWVSPTVFSMTKSQEEYDKMITLLKFVYGE